MVCLINMALALRAAAKAQAQKDVKDLAELRAIGEAKAAAEKKGAPKKGHKAKASVSSD